MNVGHLYVVHTTLTNPPKDKLVICVCAVKNLFLWINTKPRPHGVAQMPLAANDHPSLKHVSHLDCSRVTTFRAQELAAALDRGQISKALAGKIVAFVGLTQPKTLTPGQQQIILANLAAI